MSTKSAKKVSPASSATETPKSSSGSSPGSSKARSSPLSPTRITRLQEKYELQNLNDRLAAYIDRVRVLETENNRLSHQVETIQESVHKEVISMKNLYEQELSDARKLLDDTARDKAQLQIDVGKLKTDNEDMRLKLMKKEKQLNSTEKSLTQAENQIADLTSRLNTSENERKKLLAEVKELRDEVAKLSRQLAEAKKQLETEILQRVDLENRTQSLKEELDFKKQMYDQEITETKKKKHIEVSEIDNRLQEKYEAQMQDALQALRDQYEEQLRNNRDEVEGLYESKIEELNRRVAMSTSDSLSSAGQLRDSRSKVHELQSRLSYLESTNDSLNKRISDLESQLEEERDSHQLEVTSLKEEIDRLNDLMTAQLAEYQDLMDIKVALDLEIAAYRKLLEAEETRLNISSKEPTLVSERGTPVRRTPMRGMKRKRTVVEEDETRKAALKSTASSIGDIQIMEDCPEGSVVKLKNTSNKDVAVGNYQVVRIVGTAEVTYKFHYNSKVPASSEVSIWSSGTSRPHDPPLNIVMKNQKWPVGDAMTTKVLDADSKEVAVRESLREEESFSTYREVDVTPEYKRLATSRHPSRECSIM